LIVSKRSPGPFVDGAELGRVVENGSIFTIRPEMHVDPKLTRDVAFEKGSPAYEGRVVETLTNIRDAVRPVVETFRPYL
jgi:hypothetical protein